MNVSTIFNFSIPELLQRGDKFVISYNRDQDQFKGYGYGEEHRDAVVNLVDLLKALPSDEFYEGEQKLCTNKKNEDREDLENNLNDLAFRCRLALGAKSVEFSLFRFGNIHNLKDNEMVGKALHVVQVAEKRLDKLSKRQVNRALLDEILSGRDKLDLAIDEQATAASLRKEKTLERITLANDLYKKMSELCEAGKKIWKDTNEAYYTDYVIYGSSKPMADQAEEEEIEESIN